MSALDATTRGVSPTAPRPVATWRQVAMPTEHGGWSLTAEPVILGLIVAWSWGGLALGFAAVLAFLARTPLKVVLVDRWRHRWLERSSVAARIAAVEVGLIIVLAALAAVNTDNGWFWVPLAVAAPLVVVQLFFDMRSRSRRLLPELAGTVGMGSVVAAIVLMVGESTSLAIGLWVVISARAAAAIPYARTQVFRGHKRPYTWWHSDLAQLLAVASVAIVWAAGAIPLAPLVVVVAIALFNVAAVRGPIKPAKVIGFQQMTFGILVVAITATAVLV